MTEKEAELRDIISYNDHQIKHVTEKINAEVQEKIVVEQVKVEIKEKHIYMDKIIIQASDKARVALLDQERTLIEQ